MKGNMKKALLAVVVAGMGVVNFAHAASIDESSKADASADVTFLDANSISNQLTAKTGLMSGAVADRTVIANGLVHSLSSVTHDYIIAFSDNSAFINNESDQIIVKGNNTQSPLAIRLEGFNGTYTKGNVDYDLSEKAKTVPYTVVTNGAQTVAADTYTIKTSAYVFSE